MANPKKCEDGIGQEELARRLKRLEEHAGLEPEEDDPEEDDLEEDPYDDAPPYKTLATPRKTPKRKK